MTTALKKVASRLRRLSRAQRIELADALYAGANLEEAGHVNKAWSEEIKHRLDEYESGEVKAIPSRNVHAEMRRKLNEIKARRLSSRRAA